MCRALFASECRGGAERRIRDLGRTVAAIAALVPGAAVAADGAIAGTVAVIWRALAAEPLGAVARPAKGRGLVAALVARVERLEARLERAVPINEIGQELCEMLRVQCVGDVGAEDFREIVNAVGQKIAEADLVAAEFATYRKVTEALVHGLGKKVPPQLAHFVVQLRR
jgi:hypothetical protein